MNIPVEDPFDAAADPALPTVALALNPTEAGEELKRGLPLLSGKDGKLRIKWIRVTRHKPGKRCVIEYRVRIKRPDAPPTTVTLIGKIRSRRFGKEGCRLLEQLREMGFNENSPDGIAVPEPLGVIPRFKMWCQRKVPGTTVESRLGHHGDGALARRVAQAVHKLHCANVPTERRHTMADELRILHQCLAKVRELKPGLAHRLNLLAAACNRLAASVPEPVTCGIHRDFYPAQVIVEKHHHSLYLIDFDLYCVGDPGLDIGNFIAHITEASLRATGDPCAMAAQEQALENSFIALAGERCRPAVRAYTLLSLARHVYLSTQFTERQSCTERLLSLCEERLGCRMVSEPVSGKSARAQSHSCPPAT